MNRKFLLTLLVVTIISISVPAAFAGVSFPQDTRCEERTTDCDVTQSSSDLVALMDDIGMAHLPPAVISSAPFTPETTAEVFTFDFAPAAPGDPPIVLQTDTFTVLRDTGTFEYSFGFCPLSSVGIIDPSNSAADKKAWNKACLNAATELFDDTSTTVGDTTSVTTCASGCTFTPGARVFFYLIPNNNLATFNAAGGEDLFYPSQTTDNAFRAPLNSFEDANPGEFDQFLSFIGSGLTLFTWEDLTRDDLTPPGESDQDFTDLAFSIDREIIDECEEAGIPVPSDNCDCFLNPELTKCTPPGGDFLEIDSSALLLAGLQSSAIWILPIVLAGAGTGLGIAAFKLRRK